MEPCKFENALESHGEGQTAPRRRPERKRRFKLIKLEERVAPGQVGIDTVLGHGRTHGLHCKAG